MNRAWVSPSPRLAILTLSTTGILDQIVLCFVGEEGLSRALWDVQQHLCSLPTSTSPGLAIEHVSRWCQIFPGGQNSLLQLLTDPVEIRCPRPAPHGTLS